MAPRTARPHRPHFELAVGRAKLRLYHGDSLTLMPALDAGSIGVVVTSPPYNLGIRYRSYDDGRPRAEYLRWTEE